MKFFLPYPNRGTGNSSAHRISATGQSMRAALRRRRRRIDFGGKTGKTAS
jgi:hypothetical protein